MKKKDGNKKNILDIIKLIKNNDRYRSIFVLGLYFVFFGLVISSFSSKTSDQKKPNTNEEPVSVLEEYKTLSNYNFEYQIAYTENNESLIYNINGDSNNNIVSFYNEDNKYIIENNILYHITEDLKEKIDNQVIVSSFGFTPSYISQVIEKSVLETKTENYDKKTTNKLYRIELQSLVELENPDQIDMLILTVEDEENIKEVTIYFEDSSSNTVALNDLEEIKIKYLEN